MGKQGAMLYLQAISDQKRPDPSEDRPWITWVAHTRGPVIAYTAHPQDL
jgi:hypothetical protein